MPDWHFSIHPGVGDDITNIVTLIARDNPLAARGFESAVQAALNLIATPDLNLGSPWPSALPNLEGVYYFPLSRYRGRYLIFWSQRESEIRVLYVLHASRNVSQAIADDPRN